MGQSINEPSPTPEALFFRELPEISAFPTCEFAVFYERRGFYTPFSSESQAFLYFSDKKTVHRTVYGALGEIRTHDPCLRRAILYPAELQAQIAIGIIYTLFLRKNQELF